MTPPRNPSAGGIADKNGQVVQQFSMTMHNLGLTRAAEELVQMLDSGRWRQWSQGGMIFRFLPGEFDYFLSQQDIHREDVMAIPDVEVKAKLEEAMDERRTGDEGYRRPIDVARAELPELPGRQALPYGYRESEADVASDGKSKSRRRLPLGSSVRRYRNSGGVANKIVDARPRWERLAAAMKRLPDDDFAKLKDAIEADDQRRRNEGGRR